MRHGLVQDGHGPFGQDQGDIVVTHHAADLIGKKPGGIDDVARFEGPLRRGEDVIEIIEFPDSRDRRVEVELQAVLHSVFGQREGPLGRIDPPDGALSVESADRPGVNMGLQFPEHVRPDKRMV